MSDPIRNIVIVGGGTAGWMAAAALSHQLESLAPSITLIESSDIGTVGVGEATIPGIRDFNNTLGIDEREFMQATHATFKLGIEFVDWKSRDHRFFHPFGRYGVDFNGVPFHHYRQKLRKQGDQGTLGDYSLATVMARHHRFAQPHPNPPAPFADYAYAFHFDATAYAAYLRRFAEARGVRRIDARVEQVDQDPDTGFITSVRLDNGEVMGGDLFIDCSGFRGLLIEQTLKTGYEDWSHWLPCDRAVAVQSEREGDIPPYTTATAREAGWQWRIPLQHRAGNGYVYTSELLSTEGAESALLATISDELISQPRHLRFIAGRRRAFWNKNCVALGLAAGFLEPLESTSISLVQTGIGRLLEFFPHRGFDPAPIAEANRLTRLEWEQIRDFIILHYSATQREDTPLWRQCRQMALPDSLQHKLDVYRSSGRFVHYEQESFADQSWLSLYDGLGIHPRTQDFRTDSVNQLEGQMRAIRAKVQELAGSVISHDGFIKKHIQ